MLHWGKVWIWIKIECSLLKGTLKLIEKKIVILENGERGSIRGEFLFSEKEIAFGKGRRF